MTTQTLDRADTTARTEDAPGCECQGGDHPFNQCPAPATHLIGIKHNRELPCPTPKWVKVCQPCMEQFEKSAADMLARLPGAQLLCGGCGREIKTVSDLIAATVPLK